MIDQYAPNKLLAGAVIAADGLLAPRKCLRHHRRDGVKYTCQWNTGCCQTSGVILILLHAPPNLFCWNRRQKREIDEYYVYPSMNLLRKQLILQSLAINGVSVIVYYCRLSMLKSMLKNDNVYLHASRQTLIQLMHL